MARNKLDQFLNGLDGIVAQRDGAALRDWLVVNPPFPDAYRAMIAELQTLGPDGELETRCEAALITATSNHWNSFIPFVAQYIWFLRDIDVNKLLEAYELLSELLEKASIALTHSECGELILPTIISYSQFLAQFAIRLDKSPQLLPRITSTFDEFSETLPERATNLIRRAFVTCLSDKTDPANSSLTLLKAGVLKLANICLKILFAIKKTENGEQIFTNVYNQAPPLSLYPRAERVTYLFYLGRFLWTTSHWYRAQLALQTAYFECAKDHLKQRRFILVFLVASNLLLGRFPSPKLYARPEAAGFKERFQPICQAIIRGDLETFRRLTDLTSPDAKWFRHFRILLQLQNRGEVLVLRSLARKVFLLKGKTPEDLSKAAATLNLNDFLAAHALLHIRSLVSISRLQSIPNTESQVDWILSERNSPELYKYKECGVVGIETNAEGGYEYVYGETEHRKEQGPLLPDLPEVENIFLSLTGQKLLNGYISHKTSRFAIQGAKRLGALAAGFPNVWSTLTAEEVSEVPGWRKQAHRPFGGGGRVVRIENARPVGMH